MQFKYEHPESVSPKAATIWSSTTQLSTRLNITTERLPAKESVDIIAVALYVLIAVVIVAVMVLCCLVLVLSYFCVRQSSKSKGRGEKSKPDPSIRMSYRSRHDKSSRSSSSKIDKPVTSVPASQFKSNEDTEEQQSTSAAGSFQGQKFANSNSASEEFLLANKNTDFKLTKK
jgi:hypothetical protein